MRWCALAGGRDPGPIMMDEDEPLEEETSEEADAAEPARRQPPEAATGRAAAGHRRFRRLPGGLPGGAPIPLPIPGLGNGKPFLPAESPLGSRGARGPWGPRGEFVMPDWRSAKTEAEAITEGWSRERGPGGAIVMFTREGVRELASGGFADIEHAIEFTPETVTRFASISKHFLAVMLLREGISLDAPLGELLPDVPDTFRGVTLGRALDMTGALPDMMETLWQIGLPYTASLSAEDILRVAARMPSLNAEPGREMVYSNTGWRLAQRVLTAKRGIDYAECLRRIDGGARSADPLCRRRDASRAGSRERLLA